MILGMRPEGMEDAALIPSSDPDSRFPVMVSLREGMGSDVFLHFALDAPPVFTEDTKELASDIDEKALEDLKAQAGETAVTFIARAGPETTAQTGPAPRVPSSTRASSTSSIRTTGGSIVGGLATSRRSRPRTRSRTEDLSCERRSRCAGTV